MRNRNVLNVIHEISRVAKPSEITGFVFVIDSEEIEDLWTVEKIREAGFKCKQMGEFIAVEDYEGYERHLQSLMPFDVEVITPLLPPKCDSEPLSQEKGLQV